MLIYELVRLALSALFAFVAGLAGWRAVVRKDAEPTVRAMLCACAGVNAALFAGQLTLLSSSFTPRTFFSIFAALTELPFVWLFLRSGPPDDPNP